MFCAGHPLVNSHKLMRRTGTVCPIVQLVAGRLPAPEFASPANGNVAMHEEYARTALTLFHPWRTRADLIAAVPPAAAAAGDDAATVVAAPAATFAARFAGWMQPELAARVLANMATYHFAKREARERHSSRLVGLSNAEVLAARRANLAANGRGGGSGGGDDDDDDDAAAAARDDALAKDSWAMIARAMMDGESTVDSSRADQLAPWWDAQLVDGRMPAADDAVPRADDHSPQANKKRAAIAAEASRVAADAPLHNHISAMAVSTTAVNDARRRAEPFHCVARPVILVEPDSESPPPAALGPAAAASGESAPGGAVLPVPAAGQADAVGGGVARMLPSFEFYTSLEAAFAEALPATAEPALALRSALPLGPLPARTTLAEIARREQLNDKQSIAFLAIGSALLHTIGQRELDAIRADVALRDSNSVRYDQLVARAEQVMRLVEPVRAATAPPTVDGALRPLVMYLGGAGGTGKSRVLGAVRLLARSWAAAEHLLLTATTGVAAVNIGGSTIHSAIGGGGFGGGGGWFSASTSDKGTARRAQGRRTASELLFTMRCQSEVDLRLPL